MIKKSDKKLAVLIPLYNNVSKVADVIEKAKKLKLPIVVVNDGSTDGSYEKIKDINGISVISHERNMGKGAALLTGLNYCREIADWVITFDADGQHHPEDAPVLINAIPENKKTIIIGNRKGMDKPEVTWKSTFGRVFSNFWVSTSGGPSVMDTQSGFRIYPVPETCDLKLKARRFQFEVEVLVRANRKGFDFIEVPISVTYEPPSERISHFRPFVDFMRNSCTFTRLITERIFTAIFLFWKTK